MIQLMATLQAWFLTRRADERGATMVEYGLIVTAIAIVVLAGALTLGKSVSSLFNSVSGSL
jgi:pilus assembly protein Flp/PilA